VLETQDVVYPYIAVASEVDVFAASEVVLVALVSVVFEIADAVVLPVWNSTSPVSAFSIPVVVSVVWLDITFGFS